MTQSIDSSTRQRTPANRIGLDYRKQVPPPLGIPRIDVHSHVNDVSHVPTLLEAADLYEVKRIVSMTALAKLPAIQEKYADRFGFIAIPQWRKFEMTEPFRDLWCADLRAFAARGVHWCKFWVAPPMRGERG